MTTHINKKVNPDGLRRCPDRVDEYALIEAVLRHRIQEWEDER